MYKLFIMIVAIGVAACAAETTPNDLLLHAEPTLAESCTQNGGVWLAEFQECEGISAQACSALGGQFNECASACRNNPEAEFCTMQCVLVCQFDRSQANSIETFTIASELRDCVGVGPMECMVVNGNNFYDSIEGFDYQEGYNYELRVQKSERENVPADASKYEYSLIEVVSKEADIPQNCTSWFDGCNTCTVEDGETVACTEKFCFEPEGAYCQSFE